MSGTFGCAPSGKVVAVRLGIRGRSLVFYVSGSKGKVTGRGLSGVFSHCGVLSSIRVGNGGSQAKLKLTVYGDVVARLGKRVDMGDILCRVAAFAIALPGLPVARQSAARAACRAKLLRATARRPVILRGATVRFSANGQAVVIVSSSGSVL